MTRSISSLARAALVVAVVAVAPVDVHGSDAGTAPATGDGTAAAPPAAIDAGAPSPGADRPSRPAARSAADAGPAAATDANAGPAAATDANAGPAAATNANAGPDADAGTDAGADAGTLADAGADAGTLADASADAGPDAGVAKPPAEQIEESAELLINVIIGLSVLLLLAYVGGHPRCLEFEERIGIAHVITAGFPFVALGVIAHHEDVGVLSAGILQQLTPILNFGLGWLGFIIGLQLDVRFLDKLPKGTGLLVVIEASTPLVVITLACGGLMILFGQDYRDPAVIRDAVMLGAAGSMTSVRGGAALGDRPWTRRLWRADRGVDGLVSQLDEIVGIAGLMLLAAFYRPTLSDAVWQLPGTAWVFVTLGLGVAIGLLMFVMVRGPRSGAEFLAVMLGFIAFASGLAGYLRLSPIVVCFVAGILLTNFPCEQRDSLMKLSSRFERSIHLVFLIIAGALWSVGDWRGWVLVPCFVVARLGGRLLGVFMAHKTFAAQGLAVPTQGPIITPLSVLSLALVVSVERLYHAEREVAAWWDLPGMVARKLYPPENTIAWVMTAVIGGAICIEILVQLVHHPPLVPGPAGARGASGDDFAGPVYRDDDDDPTPGAREPVASSHPDPEA